MRKGKFVKIAAFAVMLCLAFSVAGCGTGNSDNAGNDPPPDGQTLLPVGTEGYYTLVQKTIDGYDVTSTFVQNYLRLHNGKAYTVGIDFTGREEQEGTYRVADTAVEVVMGVKTYSYTFDAAAETLTYTGKVNRRQVSMQYKYNKNFTASTADGGVDFVSQTELFGEPKEENFYNYCPSAIMEGNNIMHIWYCANKVSGNVTDYVAYRKGELNGAGKWVFGEKQIVLAPTAGTWDERHTCDPSVVKGDFSMGGEKYAYLMAYLGCKTSDNTRNEVGIAVAKEPQGPWVKVDALNPIANFYASPEYSEKSWGYGQPSLISSDNAGKVLLLYSKGVTSGTFAYLEEWDFYDLDHAKKLRETRLSDNGVVNASGEKDVINNADFAYDPHLKRMYCIKEDFGYPTDGGVDWIAGSNTLLYIDLGDKGIDALFGTHRWEVGGQITRNTTGFFRNHNMGIVTDVYGKLCDPYKVPVVYTMSDSKEAYPDWNLGGQWPALHTYRIHGWVLDVK